MGSIEGWFKDFCGGDANAGTASSTSTTTSTAKPGAVKGSRNGSWYGEPLFAGGVFPHRDYAPKILTTHVPGLVITTSG